MKTFAVVYGIILTSFFFGRWKKSPEAGVFLFCLLLATLFFVLDVIER